MAAVGRDDALHELALRLVSVAGSQDRQQTRRFVFDVAGMAVTIKPLTLTDESNVSEAVVETAANLIGRDL